MEIKKAYDELLEKIAEKAATVQTIEANFIKLQNSYDELLADYK